MFSSQQLGQQVLRLVGVLIFIHKDVVKAMAPPGQHFRMLLQQSYGLNDQIVKIEGVVGAQALFVCLVNIGNAALVGVVHDTAGESGGIDHRVLGATDLAVNLTYRKVLLGQIQGIKQASNQRPAVVRVIDGEVGVQPEGLRLVT